MSLAIHKLLRSAPLDDAAVDRFIKRHSFPLVEGPHTTFIFRGDVEAVHLRHWVFRLGSNQAFKRIAGTDLWFLVLELPPRSRVEYKLEVHSGGHSRWVRDPLNPNLAHDPFGANSVAHAHGYETPEWVAADPEARPGSLEDPRSRRRRSATRGG